MSSVRRSHHSQSGFSLAEVFVATAIFAVIFIAALLVYDRSNKIFKSGVEAADLQQNTRVAFDKLMADTRLAGFDFDRDGVPTSLGQAQAPDEQIEYAGRSAITIRANFDYNTANNGRVLALEPPADASSQFPIVTTGNDEIVTYALVPDSPTATKQDLIFFADVTNGTVAKRQSYPGGSIEDTITIEGVDLCTAGCNQPPYTLYRFTVNAAGRVDRTPLANNIRNLQFTYYNDILGTTPLTITDPGGGAYDPASPTTLNAAGRIKRAEIKAIRVSLVGLNASGDSGWTQVGETVASVKNRRQYTLESMVIPRNLGKRGMKEQETTAPGSPVLKTVCFNYCGLVRLTWEAPVDTPTNGEVETYHVLWDTDVGKTMTSPPQESQSAGLATTTTISGLDPTVEYRFSVAAANSYGTAYATTQVRGKPLNATTPKEATITTISGSGVTGAPVAETNKIRLAWTMPAANIDAAKTASCLAATASGTGGALTTPVVTPELGEMTGVEVWRSTDINFDPTLVTLPASTVKVATASASSGAYADTTAAACLPYYYRVRVVESCGTDVTKNVGTIIGNSAFFPAVGTPAMKGLSTATVAPAAPGPLVTNVPSEVCDSSVPQNCSVKVSWPAVTTDVGGATIAVDTYEVLVTDGSGSPAPATRTFSISGGTAVSSGGTVTVTLTNLTKKTPVYSLKARAVFTCATPVPGAYSASDVWPKCNFANGEPLTITMTGVNDGDGLTKDSAFQVTGAETIKFAVTTARLKTLTAAVYNVNTGVKVIDLTPATSAGGAIFLQTTWPDAADNTDLRVAYVLTDNSIPSCTQSGNIYVRDTIVSCPFDTTVSPIVHLPTASTITFKLLNNTGFDLTLTKAEITWDDALAVSDKKDSIEVTKIEFPPLSGSTPVAVTVSPTPKASGTFTVPIGTSVAKVFGDDKTGNYKMTVYYDAIAFKGTCCIPLVSNPITKVDIYYKLQGDLAGDPARFCTVFVKP
jgi:Tfp pilus assembly protein PilV